VTERLPESTFEHMSADDRAKERVERQSAHQSSQVEVETELHDVCCEDAAEHGHGKENRLVQASRGILEKASRACKDRSHVCSVRIH
jgi:hypothetical protein